MKRAYNQFCLTAFILFTSFIIPAAQAQSRKVESLNSGWQFYRGELNLPAAVQHAKDDLKWENVTIPHTWNAAEVSPTHARGPYRDKGNYRKVIRNFVKIRDKKYFIYFEGAAQETDLYVNGKFAGNHKGGYTAFCFEVTAFLKDGDNTLWITVDNRHNANIAPLSADFTFFGGIYRDLFLMTTSEVHFDLADHGSCGVFIETPKVSAAGANIKVTSTVVNTTSSTKRFTLRTILTDQDSKEILRLNRAMQLKPGQQASAEQLSGNIAGINLWSPDQPYLYRAESQLIIDGVVLDEVVNPVGFRWFKFDADSGFYLNGKPLKLMGANRHQDYGELGNALPDEIHVSDMKLLKDMGGNFVRLAHYPQDPAVLRAADKLGLLVWEEIPLVNEITISQEHDDLSENMLREMIRQHYNHPSIILWGYMNEIYWKHRFIDSSVVKLHTQKTMELARRLEAVARKEDKSRYTAMAMHNYPLYEESGLGDIAMVAGWNLYHGWYYDEFDDFGKFMDKQHTLHPKRIHLISEYGAGSDPRVHTTAPVRFDFSMEGQKRFLESYLNQIQERPYIAGSTVWNLIDFSSEMRVDATPRINNKGIASTERVPKDPYYFYQAALSAKPVLKIAEQNYLKRAHQQPSIGGSVNTSIDVYTNLNEVELFINHMSLGKKTISQYKTSWEIPLMISGDYQLKAVGRDNTDVLEDQVNMNIAVVPFELKQIKNIDLAINAGAHYSFLDNYSGTTWLPDKPYEKGNWGYILPDRKLKQEKIISLEDINNTQLDPLYQSMRTGMSGYQFDVADGWYEIELLCVEPMPKMRRFADSPEPPPHPGGLRVMSVFVNDIPFLEKVDLIKEYGYNHPLKKKMMVKAQSQKGILITFSEQAIVSGIRIKAIP